MRIKILILMILVVLFTIFVTQNTEVVKIIFFFWTFEMSKIVLISLTALTGLIIGFIIAHLFDKPKRKKDKKISEEENKNDALDNGNYLNQ